MTNSSSFHKLIAMQDNLKKPKQTEQPDDTGDIDEKDERSIFLKLGKYKELTVFNTKQATKQLLIIGFIFI